MDYDTPRHRAFIYDIGDRDSQSKYPDSFARDPLQLKESE
jgi:hypothetical protein